MLLLPLPAFTREPRSDPLSQRIRLKYIGDCLAIQSPTLGMQLDPLISLGLVPASEQEWAVELMEIRRYMRLYMPRTYDDLLGTTDVLMLSNTAANYFRPQWLEWMAFGTEGGLGLVMVGGYCSFGGYGYPDWGPNQVGRILPVDTIIAGKHEFPFRLFPVTEDPLLSIFDWEKGPFFLALNAVNLKPGAKLLARTNPEDRPLIVYQDVGEGSALAFMSTWGAWWGNDFVEWEYFIDFSADMVYRAAGLEIPDPVVVHEIRVLFEEFEMAKAFVASILDFVDMLGGRATGARRSLDDLVLRRAQAEKLYIEQDYAGCQDEMHILVEEVASLDELALKEKDAALLWVYLTEWSVVTATTVLSGYFLYLLMVRRRLYREAGTTRKGYV